MTIQQQQPAVLSLMAVLTALLLGSFAGNSLGQEESLVEALPSQLDTQSPFAVGGSARKALPPVDCLRCWGPAPLPPCEGHRPGFLYYGTAAAHDDPMNDFCDCSQTRCGHFAAGLSKAWIRFRSCFHVKSWLGDVCGGAGGECGHSGDQ